MKTRTQKSTAVCALAVALVAGADGEARQATVQLLCSTGMQGVVEEIRPAFEAKAGMRVEASYESSNAIVDRIASGVATDVVILTSELIETLTARGTLVPGTRADLARSGVGLAVRAGAPKPDISTADALRRTLLAAKSVVRSTRGASGLYFAGVLERLGIAGEMKSKVVLLDTGPVGVLVARGEVEIGVQQISELLPVPGIDIVGPLPGDLQRMTTFSAGIAANARNAAGARALVQYLTASAMKPVVKAHGMETPQY